MDARPVRTPASSCLHVVERHVHPRVHLGKQSLEIVYVHIVSVRPAAAGRAQAVTREPTGSPMMVRRRLPGRPQVEDDDRQAVVHAQR